MDGLCPCCYKKRIDLKQLNVKMSKLEPSGIRATKENEKGKL